MQRYAYEVKIQHLVLMSLLTTLNAFPQSAQLNNLSANDRDFVEYAGEVDLTAVQLGQLAKKHASASAVKSFGATLEQEHSQDLAKLTAIANKVGAIAPNTLDDVHKSEVSQVKAQKGKKFDHGFLKAVVNEHENALVSFKREADHGFNADLQAYAKATLPGLEEHLKRAKQLASSAE